MKPRDPFESIDEAELVHQAQRLRAKHIAGWLRGLRRGVRGYQSG